MATVTLEELHLEAGKKSFPRFKAGQTVRVYQKILEKDKERIQIFQGLIMETSGGRGITGSVTVRKVVDGIGVEKVFPLHSPFIEKIELVKEAKVRRSRIFFMRDRSGKSARLQERFFSDAELKEMMPHEVTEAEVSEAVQHEAAMKKAEAEKAGGETASVDEERAEETADEKAAEPEKAESEEQSAEKPEETSEEKK